MTDSVPTLGDIETTNRGFNIIKFEDRNGHPCSLQTSSAADFSHCEDGDESCLSRSMLWLGIDDAKPEIRAWDAIRMGIPTNGQESGWIDYPIPNVVLMHTRMHLTVPHVKALIADLQNWLVQEGEA